MNISFSEKLQSQIADRKKKYLHLVEMSSSHNKDDHNAAFDSSKAPIPTQSTDMEYDKLNSKTSAQLSSHPISIENINMVNESSQDFKIIKERRKSKKFGETNSAEISVPSNRSGARLKTKMTSLANRYNNFDNEIKPSSGFDKLPPGRINVEKHTAAKVRGIENIKNSTQLLKNSTINDSQQKENVLYKQIQNKFVPHSDSAKNYDESNQPIGNIKNIVKPEGFDKLPLGKMNNEKNTTAKARVNNPLENIKNSPKLTLENSIMDSLQAQGFTKKDTEGEVILEYKKPVVVSKIPKKPSLKPVTDEIDPALLPVNQRRLIFEKNLNTIQNAPFKPAENIFRLPNRFNTMNERGHKNPVMEAMDVVKEDNNNIDREKETFEKSTESTPRKRKSQPKDEDGETLSSRARLVDVLYKDPALHSVGTFNSDSDNDIKMGQLCARNNYVEENWKGCDNELDNNRESIDSDNESVESMEVNILSEDTKAKTADRGSFGDLLSMCQRGTSSEFTALLQNSEQIFRKLIESDRINSVGTSEINDNATDPSSTVPKGSDEGTENCENVCNTSSSALNVYRDCLEKVRSLSEANTSRLSEVSSSSSLPYGCEENDENENKTSTPYSINDQDLLSEYEKVELKKAELDKVINKEKMVRRQAFLGIESCSEKINFNDQRTFEAFKEMKKLLIISERVLSVSQEELDRLNVEKTYRPSHEVNAELESIMGDISISNIRLYINLETVSSDSLGGMENNLFCAIRHEQSILSTEIIPVNKSYLKSMNSSSSYIEFTKKFKFSKMPCNFKIFIEIYNLFDATCVGNTPVKMNASKSVSLKDKKKKETCKLRSQTKFELVGFVVFSVDELRRTHLTITKKHEVHNPLAGELDLSLSSFGVMKDNRGFLTMREVIMQWHNWTRLWFVARGSFLYYWKYPEDEFEKDPIGVFDMRNCTTEVIGPVGVDIARRPHTFQLHFKNNEPDAKDGDAFYNVILSADDEENETMWHKHLRMMLKSCNIWADVRPIDSV